MASSWSASVSESITANRLDTANNITATASKLLSPQFHMSKYESGYTYGTSKMLAFGDRWLGLINCESILFRSAGGSTSASVVDRLFLFRYFFIGNNSVVIYIRFYFSSSSLLMLFIVSHIAWRRPLASVQPPHLNASPTPPHPKNATLLFHTFKTFTDVLLTKISLALMAQVIFWSGE